MARPVCALKEDDITLPLFDDETTDPKLWLFQLSNILNQASFIEVLVTLWAIWWARRKVIHEDEFQSPLSTHSFIMRYLDELKYIGGKKESARGGAHAITDSWAPPQPGIVKINVDGAVAKSQGGGAFSAVCRDDQGRFLGCSSIKINGISCPVTLEAMACTEAMSLAADLHVRKLLIASDCLSVVKELQSKQSGGPHCMVIKEILSRRSSFQDVFFIHERREANGKAHRLARSTTTLDVGRHVWLVNPPDGLGIPVTFAITDQ
jgi:ribonuclease HI